MSGSHGEGGEAAGDPDAEDDQAGGPLALLLGQRSDDGLVPVYADGHQGPDGDVDLERTI